MSRLRRCPWCRPSFRRAAGAVALALAAVLAAGCTVFPHGAYWPTYEARLTAGGASARLPSAEQRREAADAPERPAHRAAVEDAITRRWTDEDLATSARSMGADAGRWVYADALGTVAWFYVDPIAYRDLVAAGIRSLRRALDNAMFRRRFPEADDAARRAKYSEALEILFLKASAARPWLALEAADWLAVAMEKNRAMLGLPDGAVVAEFLFGAMDSLDPYTRFLTPEMVRAMEDDLAGRYSGIGAEVAARQGRFFLRRVFEGGAAAKAGLEPGDELTAIDGASVAAMTVAEVSRRLRGEVGTPVKVTVRRGDGAEPREVALVRQTVHLPAARDAAMMEGEDGVGYLRLAMFNPGCEKDLRRNVRRLAGQGARALILDLRGNPGGSLLEAVGVAGVFLERGRVLETRGRALGATWTYDVPLLARPEWRGPMVVLTSRETASAAEVLAAALARRGRARLVGERTFGKGAVQVTLPVAGSSAVTVTIARVFDPEGTCLEGAGLAPDREVAPPPAPLESLRDDPAVRAAIEMLRAPPERRAAGAAREIP